MDLITVPPGLDGVIVADTRLSDIDGEAGRLTYRGIPIQTVVKRFRTWEELVPWLVWGERLVETDAAAVARFHRSPRAASPMVRLIDCIVGGHDQWPFPSRAAEAAWITQLPAALVDEDAASHSSAAEAYLSGMHPGRAIAASHVEALNAYWIMAAEHGLNASTFAVRVAASTGTSLPLALAAGVAALAGPLHGGAPQGVLQLLDSAPADGGLESWLTHKVENGERLMGFGHRVYRTQDPRALALVQVFRTLATENGVVRRAQELEEAALAVLQRLKPGRPLATNVEYYAAAVLRALDIPDAWCPATFACARLAGWTAHYHEQRATGRIIRPLARYRAESED